MLSTCRVVGTGSIGSRYLRLLAPRITTYPLAVSVGNSLRDPELARLVLLEPYSLVGRPSVDLTVIATRTGRHVEDYANFVDHSKKVLIEKPIAPSYRLGESVLTSDRVSSTRVSAPLRFMQGFEVVSALMNRMGRIRSVEVVCQSWLPDWRPDSDHRTTYSADPFDGGVLRDLVHEVDYALKLFGCPHLVSAKLENRTEIQIAAETSAVLEWTYEDFVLEMTLDFASRMKRRYLRVRTELTVVEWDVLAGVVIVHPTDAVEPHVQHFPQDLSRDGVLMRQLISLMSEPLESRLCTVQDALRAVALCDAARESDQTSAPVALSGSPWDEM